MRITIDTSKAVIERIDDDGRSSAIPLYSRDGFQLVSDIWLKQEWNQLHWQSFSWFGLQIWQLPEDVMRLQEVLASVQPDVIVETGISRGGSAIFFSSMCRLLGKGRVISIDIHIPEEVRRDIMQSPFADRITLIEGDSAASEVVEQVKGLVNPGEKVFVFLDSDHSRQHVMCELNAYAGLVSPGSYIVATDGVMQSLTDTPYGRQEWRDDNPAAAAREFAAGHPEFVLKRPSARFGEEYVIESMTFWPDAWLQRVAER